MKTCRLNAIKQYLLIPVMLISTTVMAQKKVDLSTIKFTENADALLKDIPYKKTNEQNTTHYEIKDPKNCPYHGSVMEDFVTIGAFNQQVVFYSASSNLTVNTNKVIKTLLYTYHQPTKKLNDRGDTRAWYWQTPTLFIQLMTTEVGFHDKRGKQISCKVQIVTLKGLKSGAEPDLSVVYQVFSTYKI